MDKKQRAAAASARYYAKHREQVRAKDRAKNTLRSRIAGLLKVNLDRWFSVREIYTLFGVTTERGTRDLSTRLALMTKKGEVIRRQVEGSWHYQWNPTPPPKKVRERVTKSPMPDFNTVAWLGTVIQGKPPGPEGRKIIALDMLCAA